MERDLLVGRRRGVLRRKSMGAKSRRRPKLRHEQVEILHMIAWALGLADVALVAITFILS